MSSLLPRQIDPYRLAENGEYLQGEIVAAELGQHQARAGTRGTLQEGSSLHRHDLALTSLIRFPGGQGAVCFNLYAGTEEEGRKTKDLDNMLKIFCDTFPDYIDRDKTTPGVGLIEDDRDDMFFRINCEKKLVADEALEGIDFTISEY